MSTPFIVCGAAGRMGRALTAVVHETPAAHLVGAIEAPGSPAIGVDAGILAGVGALGITVSSDYAAVAGADTVTLDFTTPLATLDHARVAAGQGAAIVVGTTGFSAAQAQELEQWATRTRCVIAPNMSVGIAVLQKLIRQAVEALGSDFDIEIVEMHHRMKVDAPSGTALALGRTAAAARGLELSEVGVFGREGEVGRRTDREIGVMALRGGGVVGDHTVILAGASERVELTHRAHDRGCLARGAVRAGMWLAHQPQGRYTMEDVLGLG